MPAAPGGPTDISARILAEKIGPILGTNVVVENRAGGGGIIGSEALVRSAPDGYTPIMGNIGPIAILDSLAKKLPCKPEDFVAITRVISNPNVRVVNADSPYRSVGELVAAIPKDASNLSFGSSGPGQSAHMSSEMFLQRAGIRLPYQVVGGVLRTPEIQKRFAEMRGQAGGNTPAEFGAFVRQQRLDWKPIVDTAKLSLD